MAAAKAPGISKVDAVRQALAALGKDGMPGRIQEYVKNTFGVDMTIGHISNCKSELMRKKGKKASAPRAVAAATVSAPAALGSKGVSLQDVAAVKGLVGRVGQGNLKSLIDLLG